MNGIQTLFKRIKNFWLTYQKKQILKHRIMVLESFFGHQNTKAIDAEIQKIETQFSKEEQEYIKQEYTKFRIQWYKKSFSKALQQQNFPEAEKYIQELIPLVPDEEIHTCQTILETNKQRAVEKSLPSKQRTPHNEEQTPSPLPKQEEVSKEDLPAPTGIDPKPAQTILQDIETTIQPKEIHITQKKKDINLFRAIVSVLDGLKHAGISISLILLALAFHYWIQIDPENTVFSSFDQKNMAVIHQETETLHTETRAEIEKLEEEFTRIQQGLIDIPKKISVQEIKHTALQYATILQTIHEIILQTFPLNDTLEYITINTLQFQHETRTFTFSGQVYDPAGRVFNNYVRFRSALNNHPMFNVNENASSFTKANNSDKDKGGMVMGYNFSIKYQ